MQNNIKALFDELKSKLTTHKVSNLELAVLNDKIESLQHVAEELEMSDLQTNLEAQQSFTTRFLKDIIPAGLDTYLEMRDIQNLLRDRSFQDVRPLLLKSISEFPRPIPSENAAKIARVRKLFDDVAILFTDFTGQEREIDEEVQREKDPIAFGVLKFEKTGVSGKIYSNKLVFITDWEDDYCDLILDKLLEEFDVESYSLENHLHETLESSITKQVPEELIKED